MSARARVSASLRRLSRGPSPIPSGEELFRGVFNAAANGMVVSSLDGRLVHVNRAFCELTGYAEDELVGRRFSDFTHPDDRDADAAQMRRLLGGQIAELRHRKRYVRPEGQVVWVELHCSTIKGRRGRPAYMTAQVEDVTARKRAEDALRLSEQRYRTLVQHLPDTVVEIYDRDFRNVYIGGSMFDKLGWGPDRVLGKTLDEVLAPDEAETWTARFRAALA